MEKLRVLVNRIRTAVETSDRVEVHGSRWLAKWPRELQPHVSQDRCHGSRVVV
jgi:hypothetical protein